MTIDRFLSWADRRNIVSVRSAVLAATVWMTWRLTAWAMGFAESWLASGKSGTEAAAIIAALSVPLSALQVFAFKDYVGSSVK